LFYNRWQSEFLKCPDLVGNGAKNCADGATLIEKIGAKARQAFHTKREVEF
jgi:hypothetical protein